MLSFRLTKIRWPLHGLGSIPGLGVICGLSYFVVGSRPCCEGFSPGSPVFLPPQKPNSIWNQWIKSHSVEMPLQIPIIFIYLFIYFRCCIYLFLVFIF